MTSLFKEKIFSVLKSIPKGKTMTYKQVAIKIGKPKAYRAVANIIATNFDHSIPCHRVIRTDGKIGGYNRGVKMKIRLLKSEGVVL